MTETPAPEEERYLIEALGWYERGNFQRARASVRDGLAINPEHIGLRRMMAHIDYSDDDDASASEQLKSILRDAPEDYETRLLFAQTEMSLGHNAESERVLLDLLHDHPDDATVMAQYAHLMFRTLHLDKARALASEALKREPESEYPLIVATLCDIAEGKALDAQHTLGELLERHPDARSSTRMLVAALLQANRTADAGRVVRAMVRADPRDAYAVGIARELRYAQHWSLIPMWPINRWGWSGAAVAWVGVMIWMRTAPEGWRMPVAVTYLGYCIYSWVWPPLLRRWMFRKNA